MFCIQTPNFFPLQIGKVDPQMQVWFFRGNIKIPKRLEYGFCIATVWVEWTLKLANLSFGISIFGGMK